MTMAMMLTERRPDDRAGNGPDPAGEGTDREAQELLGEMAALLRDSRPGTLTSGAALGAITVGLAVEAAALPGPRPGSATSGSGPRQMTITDLPAFRRTAGPAP
jgi:hypothetical protein